MLTVHHLGVSQSERVVWLCEELNLTYNLQRHERAPVLAPPSFQALHPLGSAPVIQDGDITLAESGACVEYIIHVHGEGKLTLKPSDKNYADYLYWLHFANGTLQPALGRNMSLSFAGVGKENPMVQRLTAKFSEALSLMDKHLSSGGTWLAGDEFTAADIMSVFTLTSMRQFYPYDLGKYENILAYLKRVAGREAYVRAMKKGDPQTDVQTQITAQGPELFPALRKQ